MTDVDGAIYQHIEFFPFGETWIEDTGNTQPSPYLFTGKELDEETKLYYYGARYYDPRTSVWQSADPILNRYLDGLGSLGGVYNSNNLNLFSYAHQNPLILFDPDGLSTEVAESGNGMYKVTGGNLADGDKGIYVVSKNKKTGKFERTGEKLGESLTMYSFYNADTQDEKGQQGWKGTIDINSKESGNLVSNFKKKVKSEAGIGLFEYMLNATDGKEYDFKRGGDPNSKDRNFHHRGSIWETKTDGTKVFGTARDVGNFAAGYLAASKGIGYSFARGAFDLFEQKFMPWKPGEGPQSTRAQELGHKAGTLDAGK